VAIKDRVGWIVGIIGALLAIAAYNPWHEYGWTTPHQHSADVNDFRAEWRCDELSEEIDELVSLAERTPIDNENIRQKRARYDEQSCHDFE